MADGGGEDMAVVEGGANVAVGNGVTEGRGGGGFGGPRPFRPAPVKVGEEFDVKIESMSKRGDAGVAKVEGLVIFVAGTKVGDNVKIRITKVGRGYATAETVGQTENTNAEATTAATPAELDDEG